MKLAEAALFISLRGIHVHGSLSPSLIGRGNGYNLAHLLPSLAPSLGLESGNIAVSHVPNTMLNPLNSTIGQSRRMDPETGDLS